MKVFIIAVLILIGLMDYALAVMCTHTEDREATEGKDCLKKGDINATLN